MIFHSFALFNICKICIFNIKIFKIKKKKCTTLKEAHLKPSNAKSLIYLFKLTTNSEVLLKLNWKKLLDIVWLKFYKKDSKLLENQSRIFIWKSKFLRFC